MENSKNCEKLIKGLIRKLKEIESDFIGDNAYIVGGALENRFVFNRLVEIIKDNPKIDKPNIFLDYIKINYVTAIVVAICRHIDRNSNSVSLINFLDDIYKNAKKITKEWFASQYKTIEATRGNNDFEKYFGNLEYVDPGIVYTDIGNLLFYTKEIKKFRHKKVAHLDRNEKIKFDIDFNTLNKVIDLIEEIIKKYYLLLTQSGTNELLPINILCFRNDRSDDEDIFCVPWKNCEK